METFEPWLFNGAYLAYMASMAAYLILAFRKKDSPGKAAFSLAVLGAILHLADFVLRAYIGRVSHGLPHYVPWSNWFESFSLFGFAIAVTFIAVQKRTRLPILGAFVMTLQWMIITFSMTYPLFGSWGEVHGFDQVWRAIASSRAIPQLMPALQSIWMAIHVPVLFTAYSAFAVAFAVGGGPACPPRPRCACSAAGTMPTSATVIRMAIRRVTTPSSERPPAAW